MARKAILVQVDPELLARLDAYTASEQGGNRSRAVAEAVEQLLARHAAFVQRQRHPDPHGGWLPAAPAHTADLTADLADRPLTHDLMRS